MKYDMKQYSQRPNNSRRLIIIMLIIMAVFGIGLWILLWGVNRQKAPAHTEAPAVKTEAPVTHDYKEQYYYAGMPKAVNYPNPLQVLTNIGYVCAYDNQRKDPAWVCYKLIRVSNLKPPPRPKGFSTDMRTTARVSSKDYTGSGFDRGHDAPNRAIGVCYGAQAQLQTFLMSNILPETKPLNEEVWEHLETTELNDYAQKYGTVYVITGPVFGTGNRKLRSGVVVPDACFKILVREEDNGAVDALAFEIPENVTGNENPAQFMKTVREIEQDTGLDFLNELPKSEQDKVETVKTRMW
jgi:endonuclease G